MKRDLHIESDRVGLAGFWQLMETLDAVCTRRDIAFFIIGALARDLLLEQVHAIQVPRATRDVDVAVAVSGWAQYQALLDVLIRDYGFRPRAEPHRLLSREHVILDLVPYGEIAPSWDEAEAHEDRSHESRSHEVQWPPDQQVVMSTLGFEEAYDAAVVLTLDARLRLRVASLAGIGLLKLIAWSERPYARRHDAEDLCFMMKHYYDVVGEALYRDHLDLFDQEPFDRDEASSRIYGRDVGRLLVHSARLRRSVLTLLEAQTHIPDASALVLAMGSGGLGAYPHRFKCLTAFAVGVREGSRG